MSIFNPVSSTLPLINAEIASKRFTLADPTEIANAKAVMQSRKSAISKIARFLFCENFGVEELCKVFIAFVPSFVGFIMEKFLWQDMVALCLDRL